MRNMNTTGNNFSQDYNNNFQMEHINRFRMLNVRKSAIIEYLFELIEKFKYEGNNHMRQYYLDNQNFNLEYILEKAIGNMNNFNKSLNLNDDLDFELNIDLQNNALCAISRTDRSQKKSGRWLQAPCQTHRSAASADTPKDI